ncbi:hypothetical protein [Nocardia carnea]|uniref:hypothetical protein n=1 Tax=Nocardia carnea TaxID=37328 RepID=UPI003D7BFCE0
MARKTGIAENILSRPATGQRRATLELLPPARTYGVPLDDLVGAPCTGEPRIHPTDPAVQHGVHPAEPPAAIPARLQIPEVHAQPARSASASSAARAARSAIYAESVRSGALPPESTR